MKVKAQTSKEEYFYLKVHMKVEVVVAEEAFRSHLH